ncbi:ROK family protein [Schaalia sp. Marseille-Q2122]|uniref:ROK family protein n=1 Tax=Schaalia sp. Marseille-Q2122 TaxID=2736604 RepID=UPI00158A3DE8|nr:ROK family protein [Schaalia sp. Marseille-Q2122]
MTALYAGIDVGGTSVKWMIVDEAGAAVDQGDFTSGGEISARVVELARSLVTEHPDIAGVGVICPGIVDEGNGKVLYAANLSLDGVPLAALVEQACSRPTLLGHDGRAAGLAEAVLGAGRGVDSFAMMPIGTGISVALLLNGELLPGSTFCAGEVGHAPIFPDGEECLCGQKGCLEVYASAKGIARRYARLSGEDIGARAVEARLGTDPIAREVWDTAVTALAISFTHLILAVDPERIIVGGGLCHAGEILLDPVRKRLAEFLRWRQAPAIVAAELGGAAGRWGAAILGCQAAGQTHFERWTV